MKITDNRTITLEIDGTEHVLTAEEAQRLYDMLATVAGIRRHTTPTYTWPNTISVGSPPQQTFTGTLDVATVRTLQSVA